MKRVIVCVFIINCVVLRKKHRKSYSAWVGKLSREGTRANKARLMERATRKSDVEGNNTKKEIHVHATNSVVWMDRYARCQATHIHSYSKKPKNVFSSRSGWKTGGVGWLLGSVERGPAQWREQFSSDGKDERKWNNNKTTRNLP